MKEILLWPVATTSNDHLTKQLQRTILNSNKYYKIHNINDLTGLYLNNMYRYFLN